MFFVFEVGGKWGSRPSGTRKRKSERKRGREGNREEMQLPKTEKKKPQKKKKRFHDLLGSWLGWLSRDRSRSSEIAMQNF